MASVIEVLVPIPRRWAGGRWRSDVRQPRTRDLRMIGLMAVLGIAFWAAVITVAVARLS